jgi:Secretion system C-terminal sorting domain/The GLUG motif
MNKIIYLIVLMFTFSVLAADGTQPEGQGTESDPYLVCCLDNLLWLSTNDIVWSGGYHYLQTENIDATETETWNNGMGMQYIGTGGNKFQGSYNGDDHYIDGLHVAQSSGIDYVGFFGKIEDSVIEYLSLRNVYVTGGSWVGGFVGSTDNSIISNCSVSGYVEGFNQIGGIAGWIGGESLVYNCYSDVTINGSGSSGNLVGHTFHSLIRECFSLGFTGGSGNSGGFVGTNCYSDIENCYSMGDVSGNYIIGGFVGRNDGGSITNCYSLGNVDCEEYNGAFVGFNYGAVYNAEITNCVWNVETSGQAAGVGENEDGTITNLLEKTSIEMQMMDTYTSIGWDFEFESNNGEEDIWGIDDEMNEGFPYLCDIGCSTNDEDVLEFLSNVSVFPNPFNPIANISFEILKDCQVSLDVYNLRGQKVGNIANGYYKTGEHTLIWNADNFVTGVYLLRIMADGSITGKKVLLLK